MTTRPETQYVPYTDGRGITVELPLALKVCHCSWCLCVMARGNLIKAMPKLKRLVSIGKLSEIGGEWNGRPVCVVCKGELKASNRRVMG